MTILIENSYFDMDRRKGYLCFQQFLRVNDRDLGGHVGTIRLIRILSRPEFFRSWRSNMAAMTSVTNVLIGRTLNKFDKSIGYVRKNLTLRKTSNKLTLDTVETNYQLFLDDFWI